MLLLGSLLSSFPCLYPLQQGLQESIWGKGEAHNPRRRCCGLACQGHVAAMWQDPGVLAPLLPPVRPSVAAPPPPSCVGEGRSKKAWGALLSQRGMRHLLSIPSQQILEAQQQLGPIF